MFGYGLVLFDGKEKKNNNLCSPLAFSLQLVHLKGYKNGNNLYNE
jgi:hypothetical protein